jgi:hypothetical protein
VAGGRRGGFFDDRMVTAGTRFAESLDGLSGGKEWGGFDFGHSTAGGKGYGDGGCGDAIRKFGDGENIEAAKGEEGCVQLTAQFFDGSTDGFQTVLWVFHESGPGFFGVADVMSKIGHGVSLLGEGPSEGEGNMRRRAGRVKREEGR